jgi:hypothetical protein
VEAAGAHCQPPGRTGRRPDTEAVDIVNTFTSRDAEAASGAKGRLSA